ncbi:hypothetical protein GGR56DRAFT_668371 [Xylariaceae sp. FL0804]|nr:hypothetical protein GGR56DRAFT_668371 [Xylariaceae sp. FL0804]
MGSVVESSQVRLTTEPMGLGRLNANPPSKECVEMANTLLQRNHDKYDMYFRDVAGHNHIPHSVLTILAMGAGPEDIKRAYDDGESIQRPLPSVDPKVVQDMKDPAKFRARISQLPEYTNFLAFFEQEIEAKGWRAVVNEHCFSRTDNAEQMLVQLFDGLYHPLIHMGFGVEFDLSSIVAEGLAQAASHYTGGIDAFLRRAEKLASSGDVPPRPLAELYDQVRANDKTRTAARLTDGSERVRDGVLGRSLDEMVAIAAQFQVRPETLEQQTAEMISVAAWTAGAAQKPGKERKIDFFIMHNVTSSIFFSVFLQQPWLRVEDKVRLVEWKARLDLVWYASCACPELRTQDIAQYEPTRSKGMDWAAMYKTVNELHDDGHVAKFIRALKNGEEVAKPFEQGNPSFPVQGPMWFQIAQMCFDTTSATDNMKVEEKWVWGAGFDPMWNSTPDFAGYKQ